MPSESGKLVNLRELHFHRIQLSTCVPDSPEDQVRYPGKVFRAGRCDVLTVSPNADHTQPGESHPKERRAHGISVFPARSCV